MLTARRDRQIIPTEYVETLARRQGMTWRWARQPLLRRRAGPKKAGKKKAEKSGSGGLAKLAAAVIALVAVLRADGEPPAAKTATEKPKAEDSENKYDLTGLTSLAAGVTALLATLGGLAVTGVLERTQRDESTWLFRSFVLVVVAGGLWVGAAVLEGKRKGLRVLGLLIFGAGLLAGIYAVLQTRETVPRPTVAASLDANGLLTGSVKAEGLKSDDVIAIQIDGLTRPPPGELKPGWNASLISSAFLGPDLNGEIDAPISLLIPTGMYEAVGVRASTEGEPKCDLPAPGVRKEVGPGCRVLPLAPIPKRPALSLKWSGTGQKAVEVKAHSTNSPHDQVLVVAVVTRPGPKAKYLARTSLEPGSGGVADVEWVLPVSSSAQTVCAEARFSDPLGGHAPVVACPDAGRNTPMRATAQLARG